LIEDAGGALGAVHGRQGKAYLRRQLSGFNRAAQFGPWFVLVDLDQDRSCAVELREDWLPQPSPNMLFRVAVHEVEGWLMGDAERLSHFLGVRRSQINSNPEALLRPKAMLVDLSRTSRRRDIRSDLVPRDGSGRTVGPAYSSRLTEFVLDRSSGWRPQVAAATCESLDRTLRSLKSLTS